MGGRLTAVLEYKIGDLVYDSAADQYGVIIETCPQFTDRVNESTICFDYTVFSSGDTFFADSDEIEKVSMKSYERNGINCISTIGNCRSS